MSFRILFYAFKICPPVLGLVALAEILFGEKICGHTSALNHFLIVAFFVLVVFGTVVGFLIWRERLFLRCPFCPENGSVVITHEEGMELSCPKCGTITANGPLGLTLVRESDMPKKPRLRAPVKRMEFRSAWFWIAFTPMILSSVASIAIYRFCFASWFPAVWGFVVCGFLVQSMRTGCLDDNAGPTFRSRQPVKFWFRILLWTLGYLFALSFPIGYARQEAGREKAAPSRATSSGHAGTHDASKPRR